MVVSSGIADAMLDLGLHVAVSSPSAESAVRTMQAIFLIVSGVFMLVAVASAVAIGRTRGVVRTAAMAVCLVAPALALASAGLTAHVSTRERARIDAIVERHVLDSYTGGDDHEGSIIAWVRDASGLLDYDELDPDAVTMKHVRGLSAPILVCTRDYRAHDRALVVCGRDVRCWRDTGDPDIGEVGPKRWTLMIDAGYIGLMS